MKILVTDGEQRPALAIVRSLARRGASVLVAADQPRSIASSSKYCVRTVTYPSPSKNGSAFVRFLVDFLTREKVDVVVPVTDVTTQIICANQDALRPLTAVAVPPLEAFEFVSNKWKLLKRAADHGVPTPRTELVEGVAGLLAIADRIVYPVVVKPIRSRIPAAGGWLSATVHYASSREELLRLYRDIEYLADHPSLIQQRIVGPGVGVFVLFDRGLPIAEFAHHRIREKPPSGGASVLCESAPVHPVLRDYVVRILGPLGWHGVAMMEFKQDQRSGAFFLMEVNGRFWGSLQLAIDAGVDFPKLACDLALGQRPSVAPAYRIGVKSRWLLGDVDHLLLRLLRTDRELELPESAPSRWRTAIEFLRLSGRDVHYDTLRMDDWRPFLYELRHNVAALWRSAGAFQGRKAPLATGRLGRQPDA